MRVLLDECVPRKLGRELLNHEVVTVTRSGWSGLKNGELLRVAQKHFDVFLTLDQNLSFQQNLIQFEIGILLVAHDNRLKTLVPLVPAIQRALDRIMPREIIHISQGD